MLVISHLCNPRSCNGNKLIKIKYEHVIAFLSRLVSYELQCSDLFTGSRQTDDINCKHKTIRRKTTHQFLVFEGFGFKITLYCQVEFVQISCYIAIQKLNLLHHEIAVIYC